MSRRLRETERRSIRAFLESHSDKLTGRVLDFGAGQQPYRDIVERVGGTYTPFDRRDFPGSVVGEDSGKDQWYLDEYDAVLCLQMVQFIPIYPYYDGLESILGNIYGSISPGGHLVMTYPTHWPEVEEGDLHRFTKAGMERLLDWAGFTVVAHEERHSFMFGREKFVYGYGVVAQA